MYHIDFFIPANHNTCMLLHKRINLRVGHGFCIPKMANIFRIETNGVEASNKNPAATKQSPPLKDWRPPINTGKMKNGKIKW